MLLIARWDQLPDIGYHRVKPEAVYLGEDLWSRLPEMRSVELALLSDWSSTQ